MENFSQPEWIDEEPKGYKILREAKEKLGLKKPLKFYPDNNEDTLRCHIDHQNGEYIIRGPAYFFEKPKSGHDIVHELCHFYLAEKINPLFAGAYLENEEDTPNFQKRVSTLYTAARLEDIWVNDIMQKLFPDIHVKGVLETWEHVKELIENNQEQALVSSQELTMALAINMVERKRHQMAGVRPTEKEIMKHLFKKLGKSWRKKLEKYTEFFATLPRLPENPQESLEIYEKSVCAFMNLNGDPVEASIQKNSDASHIPHVWRVLWKQEEKVFPAIKDGNWTLKVLNATPESLITKQALNLGDGRIEEETGTYLKKHIEELDCDIFILDESKGPSSCWPHGFACYLPEWDIILARGGEFRMDQDSVEAFTIIAHELGHREDSLNTDPKQMKHLTHNEKEIRAWEIAKRRFENHPKFDNDYANKDIQSYKEE